MKRKKRFYCIVPFVAMLLSCSGGDLKDRPLIFFNRQPSDPSSGKIDHNTMNFTEKTYYVGFDAVEGGKIQGQMILDYFKNKTKAEADRNGDGIISYVLAIGDEAHNDSKARTIGVRRALGTLVDDEKNNYKAGVSKEGTIQLKDDTLKVKEIDSQVMMAKDGATWNADAAGEAFKTWASKDNRGKNKVIDIAISNNDGMAGGMKASPAWDKDIPLFGYDANKDALQAIEKGDMTGTITQNVDAQAAGLLQLIRNIVDGEKDEAIVKKGFSELDKWGNQITPKMNYNKSDKALMAENSAVIRSNVADYLSGKRDEGIKDIKGKGAKKIKTWVSLYNGSDNFLSSAYRPALEYYAGLLNLELHIVEGDGQNETSVSNKFVNLSNYDAYAVNMVKTSSGPIYTKKLR